MKQQPVSEKDIQPHSAWQSIVLHLLPGVLLLVFFVMTIPVMEILGLPLRFSSLLGILFVLIPFELGVLFYEGKKRNGKLSLEGIVIFYRERIPMRQYLLWVPLLLVWSIIGFILLSPLEDYLIKTVFSWIPGWFIISDSGYSRITLIVMVAVYGIANIQRP